MCVIWRRSLSVRLCGAFLSDPLPGTGGVGEVHPTPPVSIRGGGRARKQGGLYLPQIADGPLRPIGMQPGQLRLAVGAGLNLASASTRGNPSRNAVVPVFSPKIIRCSYSRLFSIPLAWRNLLLANSIAPRLKVFTDGRSAAGRDLYTG